MSSRDVEKHCEEVAQRFADWHGGRWDPGDEARLADIIAGERAEATASVTARAEAAEEENVKLRALVRSLGARAEAAEKRVAELEVALAQSESESAETLSVNQRMADEMTGLVQKLIAAEAAAGQMRESLTWEVNNAHRSTAGYHPEDCDCELCTRHRRSRLALATDAGRGWVSPEQHAEVVAQYENDLRREREGTQAAVDAWNAVDAQAAAMREVLHSCERVFGHEGRSGGGEDCPPRCIKCRIQSAAVLKAGRANVAIAAREALDAATARVGDAGRAYAERMAALEEVAEAARAIPYERTVGGSRPNWAPLTSALARLDALPKGDGR